MLSVPNVVVLVLSSISLVLCMILDYQSRNIEGVRKRRRKLRTIPSSEEQRWFSYGNHLRKACCISRFTIKRFVSNNLCQWSRFKETISNSSMDKIRNNEVDSLPKLLPSSTHSLERDTAASTLTAVAAAGDSKSAMRIEPQQIEQSPATLIDPINSTSIFHKIICPFMPGCEPFGPEAEELASLFRDLNRVDIVRFLVARKGNVRLAEEMIRNERIWHASKYPVSKRALKGALETNYVVPYGRARDGSPVIYMRGSLYDKDKASPEEYVMVAAHTMEWVLRQHPEEVNITVVVSTAIIEGHPYPSANVDFMKLFAKVLSDNYPERLKKLIVFPVAWYGRAIWNMVKVFLDKRTQDKVMLLAANDTEVPAALQEIIDPEHMPKWANGTCDLPDIDLSTTVEDDEYIAVEKNSVAEHVVAEKEEEVFPTAVIISSTSPAALPIVHTKENVTPTAAADNE